MSDARAGIACARWTQLTGWLRGLPERHGRTTLILLVAILVLGFGLRAYRVVEPLPTPGDDSRAYYALSKALYEEGSFGGPELRRLQRLVAGSAAALRRQLLRDRRRPRRDGADRRAALRPGARSSSSTCSAGGSTAARPACSPPSPSPSTHPSSTRPGRSSASRRRSSPCRRRCSPSSGRASSRGCAPWLLPGFLFGLTALIRPEYLLVGIAFAVLALIRVGRERGWQPGPGRRPALLAAGPAAADRPLDGPQPGRPRPHGADLDRRRQGALRRHLPARRRRIPAGQGDARASATCSRDLEPGLRGARPRRPDAALRPRRRPATRSCPATRRWARSARRTSPSTSAKTRSSYAGDDRAQGLADVEQRRRRGDEQHRRAGRADR